MTDEQETCEACQRRKRETLASQRRTGAALGWASVAIALATYGFPTIDAVAHAFGLHFKLLAPWGAWEGAGLAFVTGLTSAAFYQMELGPEGKNLLGAVGGWVKGRFSG